ncbi:UvrB/UvrC motif-containing protein [Treponema sp.]|uniref:UvrB/UvrC motif-containing protein n=1 Tax=Treponema sp. TaxID=166 RepID=UPI0025CE897C|nr:UvrB/UvrC motif-containing protein [Treponema sp.]MCR5219123.1 UvrB/UvrC motif-containing protein [Treponema sp.]
MICDFCHEREAVIFLEQTTVNGQKRKVNICMECALERGITSDPSSISSSIGNLFKELASVSKKIAAQDNKMCPVCGTSLGSIKKTGNAGCPECYAIFKDDIKKFYESRGVTGSYTGKMPSRLASFHSVLTDRIALQNKLNAALEKEDYEKAAMYRDYLKALEKTSVSEGDDSERWRHEGED